MPFFVTGNGPDGPVRREYGSAWQAILDALALMRQGVSDVQLHDATGKAYSPTELQQLLNVRGRFDT